MYIIFHDKYPYTFLPLDFEFGTYPLELGRQITSFKLSLSPDPSNIFFLFRSRTSYVFEALSRCHSFPLPLSTLSISLACTQTHVSSDEPEAVQRVSVEPRLSTLPARLSRRDEHQLPRCVVCWQHCRHRSVQPLHSHRLAPEVPLVPAEVH